eukprot:evm.model.scf_3945.1 EVM.evm.TU.scf_3945.1   scf_3945:665-4923(-)
MHGARSKAHAESRKCDGMGQLQVGSEQRHSCQHNAQPLRGEQHLLAENRTSFSEIVENMVIQEVAESGDLQLTHGELRDLLLSTSDSLLNDFGKEFWERNSRRVVHKDAVHAVLDTRLAGEPDQLTRALVRLDSPGYIQTEVVLNEKDDGAVAVSHTQLPQRPHQGLLLSLLMLQPRALRSSTMDNDANPSRATCSRGELEGRQDCTATEAASAPVSQLSEGLVESKEKGKPSLNIAVIGAGCGALPCALCANDFGHDVHVDAVDSDPDVLSVGKQWFDFRPGPQLNIYAMDGLDFLNSQSEATYDAILIDITAPSSTPGAPLDCPPYEVMFQDGLYSLAQSRLRSGGVMAINVLGGLTKLRQVAASAAAADGRHHIRALHLPSQSVLFAVKLGDGTGQPEFGDGSAARAGFAATGKAATQRFSDAMPGALGISIACQDTLNEIAEFARKEGHQYGWKSRSALLGDVQVAEQKF